MRSSLCVICVYPQYNVCSIIWLPTRIDQNERKNHTEFRSKVKVIIASSLHCFVGTLNCIWILDMWIIDNIKSKLLFSLILLVQRSCIAYWDSCLKKCFKMNMTSIDIFHKIVYSGEERGYHGNEAMYPSIPWGPCHSTCTVLRRKQSAHRGMCEN